MRPLAAAALAATLALPLAAAAQVADVPPEPPPAGTPATPAVAPATPPAAPTYRSTVRVSPVWTQDRNFSTTRFWLLDPGTYQIETWAYARVYPTLGGKRDPTSVRFLQEIEIGVAPHLQLDLYGNFHYDEQADGQRHLSYEGYQIEARVAIPEYYGQIPTNPVIYLEWIGQNGGPARVEARVLLGGAPTSWLFLAANPYYETNVEASEVDVPDGMGGTKKESRFLQDAEVGATLAAGFRVTDWLRVSAELKIGGDMLGDPNNDFHFVWWAGPGFIVKPLPKKYEQRLKIMGTFLFLMPGSDTGPGHDAPQQLQPLLIVGTQF